MIVINTVKLLFQHTAARRRLGTAAFAFWPHVMFQHTAARRRLGLHCLGLEFSIRFNTQPPEGGWSQAPSHTDATLLSFNTQPPEGGWASILIMRPPVHCFNTQPPEGGWVTSSTVKAASNGFQHTAARRRLEHLKPNYLRHNMFQHTAARRRLEISPHTAAE